jgi:hypothetical protein
VGQSSLGFPKIDTSVVQLLQVGRSYPCPRVAQNPKKEGHYSLICQEQTNMGLCYKIKSPTSLRGFPFPNDTGVMGITFHRHLPDRWGSSTHPAYFLIAITVAVLYSQLF